MIVHELATNALKYGALSVQEGQVAIVWSAKTKEKPELFALNWAESGGPPVKQPERKDFGSRLIQCGLGERKGAVRSTISPSGRIVASMERYNPNL